MKAFRNLRTIGVMLLLVMAGGTATSAHAMNNAGARAPAILIVDDDEGHAILARASLEAAGLSNSIQHFRDGQSVLDFFFPAGPGPHAVRGGAYLMRSEEHTSELQS